MSWNYRIIRHETNDEVWYAVHEVYYDKDGTLNGWTEDPVRFGGNDREDLLKGLAMALRDCRELPVLEEHGETLVEHTPPERR